MAKKSVPALYESDKYEDTITRLKIKCLASMLVMQADLSNTADRFSNLEAHIVNKK